MTSVIDHAPGDTFGSVRGIPPAEDDKFLRSTVSAPVWDQIQASDIVGLASATAISARVYRSTVQSFPNAAYTVVVFDSERYDNGDLWSPSAPDRFVITRDGTYVISGAILYSVVAGGGHRLAGINKISAGVTYNLADQGIAGTAFVATGAVRSAVTTVAKLVPGDAIQLTGYQDSGAAIPSLGLAATAQYGLEFSIALIAGAKGEKGDTGPPGAGGGGGGGGASFEFTQSSPSSVWSVVHNLNLHPSVTVVDTGGTIVMPDIHYDSLNAVTISFGSATTGKAYLN